MVFKCPHRLAPDYFTSKFSEDTTSYNLRDSENNWNVTFEYLTHTFFSKLVLVVVAPHCVMAFLARLRRRNLLGRSNEKSAKISKARQSWQSIQENRIQNFNLSSPLHRMIETHTHTHTYKQTGFNLEKRTEIVTRFLETVPFVLSVVSLSIREKFAPVSI